MSKITLKIECDDEDQANVYLNAYRYLNALEDMNRYLRTQEKYGNPCDDIATIRTNFFEFTEGLLK
jgi:hypothetical protein